MNPRRQSTVHDLAALRLHRDGSRILNSDTNLSSRRAKYATRDARGNWIAQDAGGLGTVKLRRSASQPDVDQDAVSEHAADEEVFDDSQSRPSRDKGKGRADDRELEEELDALNPRARKRRRFDEDMGYLDSRPSLPTTPRSDGEPLPSLDQETHPGCMPTPSSASDLFLASCTLVHINRPRTLSNAYITSRAPTTQQWASSMMLRRRFGCRESCGKPRSLS